MKKHNKFNASCSSLLLIVSLLVNCYQITQGSMGSYLAPPSACTIMDLESEDDSSKITRRDVLEWSVTGGIAAVFMTALGTGFYYLEKRSREKRRLEELERQRIRAEDDALIPQYPQEKKQEPLHELIDGLNAQELAKKTMIFHGNNGRYKQFLSKPEEYKRSSPEDEKMFQFAVRYARFEAEDVIRQAIAENRYMGEEKVRKALYRKIIEILSMSNTISVTDAIQQAPIKSEKLLLFIQTFRNISRVYIDGYYHFLNKELFMQFMEIHGLGSLFSEYRELNEFIELCELLGKSNLYEEKIIEKTNFLNEKLFIPHGFYAPPEDMADVWREKWTHWLYKLDFQYQFKGKNVYGIRRIRDTYERLNVLGSTHVDFQDHAVVLLEEVEDNALRTYNTVHGIERYSRHSYKKRVSKPEQDEFKRSVTLMFLYAAKNNECFEDYETIKRWMMYNVTLHEMAHLFCDDVELEEAFATLIDYAYGQPHIGIEPDIYTFLNGRWWLYDWVFTAVTKEHTGNYLFGPGDVPRLANKTLKIWRGLSADEIRKRAFREIQNRWPYLSTIYETPEGIEFRKQILDDFKLDPEHSLFQHDIFNEPKSVSLLPHLESDTRNFVQLVRTSN